jgi:single-strand DNA-binding protein
MINKAILVGNLGKDPEVKTLENGTKVATFSVATSESYKDKNDTWQTLTEWHNVVAWRGLAERAEKLSKGVMVYIEGKITHRKYNDKDGVERMTTEIVANTIVSTVKSEKSSSNDSPPPPSSMDGPIPF